VGETWWWMGVTGIKRRARSGLAHPLREGAADGPARGSPGERDGRGTLSSVRRGDLPRADAPARGKHASPRSGAEAKPAIRSTLRGEPCLRVWRSSGSPTA
ncbi:MAG: hypothetical protein ABEI52_03605, partial [Halobacteriaceae archaeon]